MTIRRFLLVCLCISGLPAAAAAQDRPRFTAGATLAVARTWDDESLLGPGFFTEGRAGVNLTSKTQLEFAVAHIPYDRSFESGVATEGRSIFTGLILKQDFTRGTVRPFVLAGYGLNHHRGTRTDSFTAASTTRATDHGYVAGAGFVIARGRWQVGPEARFYMLSIDNDSSASMMLSGGVRGGFSF